MLLSIKDQNDYNFKIYDSIVDIDLGTASTEDIKSVFTSNITAPMSFKNNRKTYENYVISNCIFLDFETKIKNGRLVVMSSIEDFMATNFYKWFKCVVITSKSHRNNGNGDCFHVVVQMDDDMNSLDIYKSNFKDILSELDDEHIISDSKYTYACFSKSPSDCEIYTSHGEYREVKSVDIVAIEEVEELEESYVMTDAEIQFNAACRLHKEELYPIILKWCQDIQERQSSEDSVIRTRNKFKVGYAKFNQSQWLLSFRAIRSLFGNTKEGKALAITISNCYVEKSGELTPKKVIYKKYESLAGEVCISSFFGLYKLIMEMSHSWHKIYKLRSTILEISRIIGMEVSIDEYTSFQKIKRGRTLKSNTESISIVDAVKKISETQNIIEDIVSSSLKINITTINPIEVKSIVTDEIMKMFYSMMQDNGKVRTSSIKILRDQIISDMGIVDGLLDKHIKINEIKKIIKVNGYEIKTIKGIEYFKKASTSPEVKKTTQAITEEITQAPAAPMDEREGMYIGELDITTKTYTDWDADYDFGITYREMDRYNDEEGLREQLFPPKVTTYVFNINMERLTSIESLIKNIEIAKNFGFIDSRLVKEDEDMYGVKQYA